MPVKGAKRETETAGKVHDVTPADPNGEGVSSPDRLIDAIHRGILVGRYVPGQKLIEADLTQSLGISRGPVREALKRLSAEGVVELSRHRGAYIRSLTRREALDTLEILEVLTALIARLAANAIVSEQNADLVRDAFGWLERFKDPALENLAFTEQRSHFYDTLIRIGGNSQLQSVMPMMRVHLLRLQVESYFSPEDRRDRVDEYAAITDAVLAGDAARAQRAMYEHMMKMRQRIERLPEEAFVRRV
ncbi:GntR family transcriptional regulator [Sphingopyxis sp. J-6]|uniref:GntR family transcriptional regulator n=1 Tax=Sphingopyxis sp. J-6 TaxID=3122054 RepID=UPI00398427FA